MAEKLDVFLTNMTSKLRDLDKVKQNCADNYITDVETLCKLNDQELKDLEFSLGAIVSIREKKGSINNVPKTSKSDDSSFKVPNIPKVDQNNNFHYMGNEQKRSTIKKIGLMKRYLATRKNACFTIVRKNLVCTFAHGSHTPPENPDQPGWKIGDIITDIQLYDGSTINCVVKKIDVDLDCVWLKPEKDIEIPNIVLDPPFYTQEVIVLGLSGVFQKYPPEEEDDNMHDRTSYDICNVSCPSLDAKYHCKTSNKSSPGDSGAPIFDYWDGKLIGMMVGVEAYSGSKTGSEEKTGCLPSRDRHIDQIANRITTDQITTDKELLKDIITAAQTGGYGGKGIFISSFILASGYTETE